MSSIITTCTGVILAGGENIRMPVLKAFIKVNGERIIERNLKIMKKLFKEVFIITNQPEMYAYLSVSLIGDVYNKRGPMTGILSALLNSSHNWVFISACDMPFINEHLITYMATKRGNYDAVAPKFKGTTEPLFAFYSKRLVPSMEKTVVAGTTGARDFLNRKKVKYIYTDEIKNIHGGMKSFINLNTPEDIKLYVHHKGIPTK
ncbi:MAG: molybdenum cofactor guanylyltransferase [Thermodesulfovibrionia bacterium]|nr:molybdenum cofactor guanylyltransferase [Thermodesulfovibrionia bacterium]